MWKNSNWGYFKKKQSILAVYASNASKDKTTIRDKQSEYAEVNKILYEWYVFATSKNVYPGGRQLQEKAKDIAHALGMDDFKASNGWLDKWKNHYNIKQVTTSGESGHVLEGKIARIGEKIQG